MQPVFISPHTRGKLRFKHRVSEAEILQCFEKGRFYLVDDRAEHATEPPTFWFIERTKRGRPLKVVFIVKNEFIHIKTAYDADKKTVALYNEKCTEFLLGGLS